MQKLVWITMLAACGHGTSSGTSPDATGSADAAAIDATVPIPPVCTNGECVCDAGYRPCTGGCCALDLGTVTLDGVSAEDVRMEYAPDGTAYILVEHTPHVDVPAVLELYARAPGGPIVSTHWTATGPRHGMFDLSIRSDGTLLIVYGPTPGEATQVQLVTWKAGVASAPITIGNGFGYTLGLSTTLDGDETLWATWSTARSGGMSAYSLSTGGTQRTYSLPSSGTPEVTDAQFSPTRDTVYSFYAHCYTGNLVSHVNTLAGTTTLTPTCPADSAAFDSAGHVWSAYNTCSSNTASSETRLCRDGESSKQPTRFETPRIAIDGDDIAYTASYDYLHYTATWYASADNHGWTHGTIPTEYGIVPGWNRPGLAAIALARDPHGRMSIVVVPEDAAMGAMVLATLQ